MQVYQGFYFALLILNLIIASYRWEKLNQSSHWGAALILATTISEVLALTLAKMYHQNLWWYHIFVIVQFLIITKSYSAELSSKEMRLIVALMAILIVGLSLAQPFRNFPSYSVACNSFFTILLALLYLRGMLVKKEEGFFTDYSLFWVSLGWLFFCTATLIDFSAYNYFGKTYGKELRSAFLNIRVGCNYLLYFSYLIGFLSKQKQL